MLDPNQLDQDQLDQDQLDPDQLDPELAEHRSTGPRTPHGKSTSSKNSVKHGCRSNIFILYNEKLEDFAALYDRWKEAYQPISEAELELLEQFVLNKWYLIRNERRFNEVENQLSFFEFTKWNEGQHRIYQLTLRYKTAAERAAAKAQRDLEDYLKNRRAEEKYRQQLNEASRASYFEAQEGMHGRERALEEAIEDAAARGLDVSPHKSELTAVKKQNRATLARLRQNVAAPDSHKTPAQILFQGQNSPKKLRNIPILDQWVEVTVKDGVTHTHLTPSNQKLIARGQTMDPPPELVYRRLNFPDGVPDEYDWTVPEPLLKQHGGLGIQRMSVDTWLELIDEEALRTGGHIGPCSDPLPRPRERGGCECPACNRNRERLLFPSLPSEPNEPETEQPPEAA